MGMVLEDFELGLGFSGRSYWIGVNGWDLGLNLDLDFRVSDLGFVELI